MIRDAAIPLTGSPNQYDPLLDFIGDRRIVLIGEASHGTHEFYRQRALITQRLIAENGFTAVVAEADWPDAYEINRYVRDQGVRSAEDALTGFLRFPTWMWRNTDVLDFIQWLRGWNAGFYGMDLYSLRASSEAVIRYLDRTDPAAASRARFRYGCFEDFGEDPQAYGYAASYEMSETCQKHVVMQLIEMQRTRRSGDDAFFAEQNARLVKNAEEYYRTMFSGRVSSWNLRDRHMVETLEALMQHLGNPKIVVWAHNSHLGDARATEMNKQGEWNVGQLVREKWPNDCVLIGQTTYAGTVMAADDWDGPALRKTVRPGMRGSYEELFHEVGLPQFLLLLRDQPIARELGERLERAIGVIYRPATERISHYFHAKIADQFDAVLHFDRTTALEPLETLAPPAPKEEMESYPTGV